ncbi:MAG: ATP-binding protein [Chlamydiales bacterium]|nr:ATP-binding protein [Chlamydiales bacterium]
MLFLVGPRQVGKTTLSLKIASSFPAHHYLTWDSQKDRSLIVQGADVVADSLGIDQLEMGKEPPLVIFDELHKYKSWKNFLKGFYDKYSSRVKILVTGSARLDIYKVGGDSLMGRYFLYRLHPFSVAEIIRPMNDTQEIASKALAIDPEDFNALYKFGGFPDPFLKRDPLFYNQWKRLRFQQLFNEDLRDLTRIQDISQIQILAELLQGQAGQMMSFQSLANKVNVSVDTIRRWIETLKSFYYCFTIRPWTKNVNRSLLKEPKIYLWDWGHIEDEGAKQENFVASQLLKAVQFWTDRGFGTYDLYYLRNKEKQEVDFLVSKDTKPWFIVEVKKSSNTSLSKPLFQYQQATKAPHAFQVVFEKEYDEGNCFDYSEPTIVSAKSFLSQLI